MSGEIDVASFNKSVAVSTTEGIMPSLITVSTVNNTFFPSFLTLKRSLSQRVSASQITHATTPRHARKYVLYKGLLVLCILEILRPPQRQGLVILGVVVRLTPSSPF